MCVQMVLCGDWWRRDSLWFTEIHIDMESTIATYSVRSAQAIPPREALVQRKSVCTNSYMHHIYTMKAFVLLNEWVTRTMTELMEYKFQLSHRPKKKPFTWPMTAFDGAVISCCYHIPIWGSLSCSSPLRRSIRKYLTGSISVIVINNCRRNRQIWSQQTNKTRNSRVVD